MQRAALLVAEKPSAACSPRLLYGVLFHDKAPRYLSLSRKNHFADLSPRLVEDVLDLVCLLVIEI